MESELINVTIVFKFSIYIFFNKKSEKKKSEKEKMKNKK